MKHAFAFIALLTFLSTGFAQVDTVKYDGMTNLYDGQLLAVTQFPGETQIFFNTLFSPTEKCTLLGVRLAFSVVKFQLDSGYDTLIVLVYENTAVPPNLVNIQKTYKVPLGNAGFPYPNINPNNPMSSTNRDTLTVFFNPPVVFAPKRDFLIGVRLLTKQTMPAGAGDWHGLTFLIKPNSTEFQRYRRYSLGANGEGLKNELATAGASASLYMRALVKYDPNLTPVVPTAATTLAVPAEIQLHQNYPNPFYGVTQLAYSISHDAYITLAVFDAVGRQVARLADGQTFAGTHSVEFNAEQYDLPPGMYTVRLSAGDVLRTKQVTLLR